MNNTELHPILKKNLGAFARAGMPAKHAAYALACAFRHGWAELPTDAITGGESRLTRAWLTLEPEKDSRGILPPSLSHTTGGKRLSWTVGEMATTIIVHRPGGPVIAAEVPHEGQVVKLWHLTHLEVYPRHVEALRWAVEALRGVVFADDVVRAVEEAVARPAYALEVEALAVERAAQVTDTATTWGNPIQTREEIDAEWAAYVSKHENPRWRWLSTLAS